MAPEATHNNKGFCLDSYGMILIGQTKTNHFMTDTITALMMRYTLRLSPVCVVVVLRQFSMVSRDLRGIPAQPLDTSLKTRCSIGFHLETPLGK